jgi:hypothetical protein
MRMRESRSSPGTALELVVAEAYRDLGARNVQHNVEVAGHQIDVYVEFDLPDRGVHRIIIEAKDLRPPVGIKLVSAFASLVTALRGIGLVESGVVIGTNGFTRPARNHAEQCSFLRLLELADLKTGLGVTAPKPTVRVVPTSCMRLLNYPPYGHGPFMCVSIQNHSPQTVYMQGLRFKVRQSDMLYLLVKDAATGLPLSRRQLSAGESYIISIDPQDLIKDNLRLDDIEEIIATDDVGREYGATKESIRVAISQIATFSLGATGE